MYLEEITLSNYVAETHPLAAQTSKIKRFDAAINLGSSLFPNLAGWVMSRLICRPFRRKMTPTSRAFLATSMPINFTVKGQKIMGYAWGEGPTILFVHGWTNHTGMWQSYVAQLMDSGYRVVAFDAPAHGQSQGKILTPLRYMNVISAFIENIGMPHAIVGHSYGAMCAVLSLRNKPHYPQKMVLLGTFEGVHTILKSCAQQLNLTEKVQKAVRKHLKHMLGGDIEAISVSQTLPQFSQADVLIVHDKQDPVAPVGDAWAMANAKPNASLLITNGLGHKLRHDDVVDKVVGFIVK
jgi:pimeloyl-ACP methyl ester carboxylesterase